MQGDLASHYRTFKTFNLGGAVEFLFSVSALTKADFYYYTLHE